MGVVFEENSVKCTRTQIHKLEPSVLVRCVVVQPVAERWGAGVETQKYVRGDIGGWGRVPFSRNLMSPTPRRKWYLTTGRRFH